MGRKSSGAIGTLEAGGIEKVKRWSLKTLGREIGAGRQGGQRWMPAGGTPRTSVQAMVGEAGQQGVGAQTGPVRGGRLSHLHSANDCGHPLRE